MSGLQLKGLKVRVHKICRAGTSTSTPGQKGTPVHALIQLQETQSGESVGLGLSARAGEVYLSNCPIGGVAAVSQPARVGVPVCVCVCGICW